jgi:hypothetical protein
MAGVRITIDKSGLAGIERALAGLNKRDAKNTTKRAFTAFGRDVRESLRAVEPSLTGGLRKGTKSKSTQGGGVVIYGEHPRAAHANIVKKGTAQRRTKKGAARGAMPGNAAMQAVLAEAATQGAERVAQNILNDIASRVEKASK